MLNLSSCYFKHFISVLITVGLITVSKGQVGLCPPNLDFENGNLTNWICRSGSVSVIGGLNTFTWTGTGQVNGRHTIINAATAGIDQYGQFPQICPNGSRYSVRLGNNLTGSQAEGLSYVYTIPSTVPAFSVLFHYAVVLQNPSHSPEQQPRFRARIIDLSTNSPLPCVTFDFTASSSLPGFSVSSVDRSVLFKDWTPVSVNLNNYIGKTIQLEFITTDCTQSGHFGYAYVDVNSACNGAISGSTICLGNTSVTLSAPFGFQSYQWYADNTFSQVLATTQTLELSPTPAVGTVFPVVVQPFPGFGCPDTLYATISIAPKPVSVAGRDTSICKKQRVQLGGASTPAYSYSWVPATQVDNPAISNPVTVSNLSADQTEFIVKTTNILTGCYSYDTVLVSSTRVDTAVTVSGTTDYCIGGQPQVALSVNNSATTVQWYDVNGPIPGAVAFTYRPVASGDYWASITKDGCTDSTGKHSIVITAHPLPQAIFSPILDSGCIATNSFAFTNASIVSDGSPMTALWKFSDGERQQTYDAIKTFANQGVYTVELVATTAIGCKDSTTGKVTILPNGAPAFLWDSICINRPVLFRNLSNEKGWPRVNYNWDFNNGGPDASIKNPLPVTYTTPGKIDVTLTMTIVGCENDPKSITQSVSVNAPVAGTRYRDITVPLGNSWPVRARDGIGNSYNWRPQMYLSSYSQKYTEFHAVADDIEYLIDITDVHTCVTTDTLQMVVLKKPGFYLPSAFTPNKDGLNDFIIPYLVGMKSLISFSVYNRWGNLIFYTETDGKGWDGKYKGIEQPSDVYVWKLVFLTNDNKKVIEKGTITLIR